MISWVRLCHLFLRLVMSEPYYNFVFNSCIICPHFHIITDFFFTQIFKVIKSGGLWFASKKEETRYFLFWLCIWRWNWHFRWKAEEIYDQLLLQSISIHRIPRFLKKPARCLLWIPCRHKIMNWNMENIMWEQNSS